MQKKDKKRKFRFGRVEALFDCCEMNSNKKRRTVSGNTEPESNDPRSDVEKPEKTQE